MSNLKLKVYSQTGEEVSTLEVSKDVFGVEVNEQVIFDAVLTYLANRRQATAKTKKRFEVSGGGRKPWRQKGTGRARAGSTRSPIWVGGGTVFGPTGVQNFKIKQNKKEHQLALKGALSLKAKKDLVVLNSLSVEGKTKEVVSVLNALKVNDSKVLLITDDTKVMQASNNLENINYRGYDNISVYDLMNAEKVIMLESDVKKIEEALK